MDEFKSYGLTTLESLLKCPLILPNSNSDMNERSGNGIQSIQ